MNPMFDFVHVYLVKDDRDADFDFRSLTPAQTQDLERRGAGTYYPKGTYLDVDPVSDNGNTLSGSFHHQGKETRVKISWIQVFGKLFSDAVGKKTGKGPEERISRPKSVLEDLLENEFSRCQVHWMCDLPQGVIAIQIADPKAMADAYRGV